MRGVSEKNGGPFNLVQSVQIVILRPHLRCMTVHLYNLFMSSKSYGQGTLWSKGHRFPNITLNPFCCLDLLI